MAFFPSKFTAELTGRSRPESLLVKVPDAHTFSGSDTTPSAARIVSTLVSPARLTTAVDEAATMLFIPNFRSDSLPAGEETQDENKAGEEVRRPELKVGFEQFSAVDPERTVANEPANKKQEKSKKEGDHDVVVDEDNPMLAFLDPETSGGESNNEQSKKSSARKGRKLPKPQTGGLTDDFVMLEAPWERHHAIEEARKQRWQAKCMALLAKSKKKIQGREAGEAQSGNLVFRKEPVSQLPSRLQSVFTEQLRALEEAEAAEWGDIPEDDADEMARMDAELREKVTRALDRMRTGNSAASRISVPAPGPRTKTLTRYDSDALEEDGLVYLPYGAVCDRARSVPMVQLICCNCAGVSLPAEFHCLTCRVHTRCKDCSVAVPMWYSRLLDLQRAEGGRLAQP